MFCKNCGAQIKDGVSFCANCGSKVEAAPTAQEIPVVEPTPVAVPVQAVSEPNPTLDGFSSLLKKAFSLNANALCEEAANTKALSWIIFAAISVVIYGLAHALNLYQDTEFGYYFDFGSPLLYGMLYSAVMFGAMGAGTWLIALVAGKTDKNILSGFSVAGVAVIPVIAVCTLNLILGFIDYEVVAVMNTVAKLTALAISYIGITKMSKKEVPFLCYIIYVAGLVITNVLVSELISEIVC